MSKKSKKKKNKSHRAYDSNYIFFKNNDYTSDGPNETSPGGGLFHGEMDKYKSVGDFLNKRRKQRKANYEMWYDLLKTAQTFTTDTSLVDSLKQAYASKVQAEVEHALSQPNAPANISSVPIRIDYNNKKANIIVQSTGQDSAKTDPYLSKILNAKYSGSISVAINKALNGKLENFNFGFLTLEFN